MGAAHLENFLRKLKGCRPSGREPNQYVACCPAHPDGDPSLAVSLGDNGAVVLKCFAGCSSAAVLEALRCVDRDLYPADGDGAAMPRIHRPDAGEPAKRQPRHAPEQWEKWNAGYAEAFAKSTVARPLLAKSLDLPEAAFDLLPGIGARTDHRDGPCWTFPERDAAGRIVGLGLRFKDGKKKAAEDGERGLSIPGGWCERPGALFLPEGPSDTLALSCAGLGAVGRPGLDCKLQMLADFVRAQVPADRPLVWLGENDKSEKTIANSRAACEKFARLAERPVEFRMVPRPHKDARAALVALTSAGDEWPAAGAKLVAALSPGDTRIVIALGPTNEEPLVDSAIEALAGDPQTFARGDSLVTVLEQPSDTYKGCSFPPAPRICPLTDAIISERLGTRVDFTTTREKKLVSVLPPERFVHKIRDRKVWSKVRYLETVVEYPVLRPDGTISMTPGYDERTGTYYAPSGETPVVPENPTKADALAAMEVLDEMVCDFPFAGPPHKSSWLASFLTPLARYAFRGPAPMFLFEGNIPAAGKGLLADMISIPLTGQEFACSAYTPVDEEMQKRITTLALAADKLVLWDNIAGAFGGPTIDLLLTAVRWTGRLLGSNTNTNLPLWATWYGTGNNVHFQGDILRRICPCRIVSPASNPEERANFRHPDLREWVKANRPRILGAALTLLRAYMVAGAPRQSMRPWGSYEGWSRIVRGTIIWLGLPDPMDARQEIHSAADATRGAMETVVTQFHLLDQERKGVTAGQVLSMLKIGEKNAHIPHELADLAEAVESLLPRPTAAAMGRLLMGYRERRIDGRYLDYVSRRASTTRWGVFEDATKQRVGVVGMVGTGGDKNSVSEPPFSPSLSLQEIGKDPTIPTKEGNEPGIQGDERGWVPKTSQPHPNQSQPPPPAKFSDFENLPEN